MRTWQTYQAHTNAPDAPIWVTISACGQLYLPQQTAYPIADAPAVQLLYDSDTRSLGIQALADRRPGALRLSRATRYGRVVSIKGFLLAHGYSIPSVSVQITPTIEDGVLVVPLGPLEVAA